MSNDASQNADRQGLLAYLNRIIDSPVDVIKEKAGYVSRGMAMIHTLYPRIPIPGVSPIRIDTDMRYALEEYGVTETLPQLILSESATMVSGETGVAKPEVLSRWFDDQYRHLTETAYQADVAAGDIATIPGVALTALISLLLSAEPTAETPYRNITELRENILRGNVPREVLLDAISAGVDEFMEKEDFRYARMLDEMIAERGMREMVMGQLTRPERYASNILASPLGGGPFLGSKLLHEFAEWLAIPSVDVLTTGVPYIGRLATPVLYNLWEIADLGDLNTTTTMGKAILKS